MKKRVRVLVHRTKESNSDLADHFENQGLKYLGYETELIFEIDTVSGGARLIGAEGKFLGDESTDGEAWDWDEVGK